MKESYISPEGLEKIKLELKELVEKRRPEVIERISVARDQGDLSENAEYHEAREEQSFIEGKVQELEQLIKNAVVIEGGHKFTFANIGSTVHATCDNGLKIKYQIVGPSEADPVQGRISHESPFGQALLGKAVGEEFELKVPAGVLKCKIDKIE